MGRPKLMRTIVAISSCLAGMLLFTSCRHGETANNKNNLFRGWIDVPLNDTGKKEAQTAREFLADKKIKRVFCSDLARTEVTAKLAIPSIKAERDPLLRPWDVGVFSGKPRDEYSRSTSTTTLTILKSRFQTARA